MISTQTILCLLLRQPSGHVRRMALLAAALVTTLPIADLSGQFNGVDRPSLNASSASIDGQSQTTASGASRTSTEKASWGSPSTAQAIDQAISLESLEAMAFEKSPVIAKLQARIDALRGKQVQAGLRPNPKVGIMGEDIFDEGNGGRFGVFVGREVVRGNKLALSQNIVGAEMVAAERQLETAAHRLLTDVRSRYYDSLLAQRKVELTGTLVAMLEKIVASSQALFDAQEVAKTALLQSEIELENAIVIRKQAENDRLAAFGRLAGLLNEPSLPFESLSGDVTQIPQLTSIEVSFDRILQESPEIARLLANVETAKRVVSRACVEPIPNVTWQSGLSYDTVSDDMVASFQIGMPLPTQNFNQGAIAQARKSVVASQRSIEQKVLQIRQRLISEYRSYNAARIQVDAYEDRILPKSKESLELSVAGYEQGEVSFLNVLTAQRTFFQVQLNYLDQLKQLRGRAVLIEGNLLADALNQN